MTAFGCTSEPASRKKERGNIDKHTAVIMPSTATHRLINCALDRGETAWTEILQADMDLHRRLFLTTINIDAKSELRPPEQEYSEDRRDFEQTGIV